MKDKRRKKIEREEKEKETEREIVRDEEEEKDSDIGTVLQNVISRATFPSRKTRVYETNVRSRIYIDSNLYD